MAVVSDTRSVDIEDDIKRRRPPIHPPICICLILKPRGGGSSCTPVEEPARQWSLRAPVEESARRWRSPLVGGATWLVEDPAHRWRSMCAGGARSPVEEPTRRWKSSLAGAWTVGCRRAHMEVAWNPSSQTPMYRLDRDWGPATTVWATCEAWAQT
jgi:hypothetical protein